jgi:hypothetical protein
VEDDDVHGLAGLGDADFDILGVHQVVTPLPDYA